MSFDDRDKPFSEIEKDPRTAKMKAFVTELLEVKRKYGLRPTEAHVSPHDDFLCRFGKICGLEVVKDYNIPKGNIILL